MFWELFLYFFTCSHLSTVIACPLNCAKAALMLICLHNGGIIAVEQNVLKDGQN